MGESEPTQPAGYTLSDLKRMRAENRAAWDKTIRDREVRLMEQLGPDVYFHVLGRPDRPTQRRKRPPTVVEGRFSQSDLKRSLAAG